MKLGHYKYECTSTLVKKEGQMFSIILTVIIGLTYKDFFLALCAFSFLPFNNS